VEVFLVPYIPLTFSGTSAWTQEYGGLIGRTKSGEPLKEVYFMGLIDILTEYDIKKKSEYAIKSLLYMGSDGEISAQPPTFYRGKIL
jgi:1-phosphatidylinositol-4-phosphate 5-kinase